MSNLFNAIERLKLFSQNQGLPEQQKHFILSILSGSEKIDSLHNIISYRKKEDLAELQKNLKEMIKQTPYFSFSLKTFNFSFIRLLKNLLHDVEAMQKAEETFTDFANKNPKRYKKYIKVFDSLYQTTEHQFKGSLMMPIMQGMDARLGDSKGECFGYIAEWASQLYQNKKFMGIFADRVPPFKRVAVNSKTWASYPDLNHLAFLTPNISYQQRVQADISELTAQLSIPFFNRNQNISYTEGETKFYSSVTHIAEELIQRTEEQPEHIYNLNVMGYLSGHALGFCKVDGKYHFMDSNSGWFRFENADDFKKWLPFYFQQITYDKVFAEYTINTYTLNSILNNTDAVKKKNAQPKMGIAHIIVAALFSPLIAIMILTILTNFFVIRGIYYAVFELKNLFKKEEPIPVSTQDNSPLPVPESLPKTLDYLDLAVRPASSLKQNTTSSVSKIAGMLDIPLKDLSKVQKRAETNEAFKGVKKPPIVEENSEIDFGNDHSSCALPT